MVNLFYSQLTQPNMDKMSINAFCLVLFLLPMGTALTVHEVVDRALLEVAAVATGELQKLHDNPQLRDSFVANLTAFVEKDACFEKALMKSSANSSTPTQDVETLLLQCYSPKRIKLIKHGLKSVTYRLNFMEGKDGQFVRFTRHGREIFPAIEIHTQADLKQLSDLQIASIVIEAVDLVLQVAGISVKLKDEEIEKIAKKSIDEIDDNRDEINSILEEFKSAPSATDKAKAIFHLLQFLNKKGLLWDIIKDICTEMTWYEWLEAVAKVSVTIIAALVTDGGALIIKIAFALKGALQFGLKFASLAYLSTISTYLD